MLAEQVSKIRRLDNSSTNSRYLIGSKSHADTGAADEHAPIGLSFRHHTSYTIGVVWIIAAIISFRTKIYYLMPKTLNVVNHGPLLDKTSMIRGNCNAHEHSSP